MGLIMKYFPILILLVLSSQAKAIDFQLEVGIHKGGEVVTGATYTTGFVKTIDAGDGTSYAAGIVFNFDKFATRFKYGTKKADIEGINGSLNWERNTTEALLMRKIGDDVQIGVGLTYHSNVEIRGTQVLDGSTKFDNALGVLAEIDYFWDPKSYIGLSFTSIEYEINNTSFDGSSIGVVIGGIF